MKKKLDRLKGLNGFYDNTKQISALCIPCLVRITDQEYLKVFAKGAVIFIDKRKIVVREVLLPWSFVIC